MVSFSESVERIKGDLPAAVPPGLMRRLCGELEITGRQRLLTPVVTTYLTLLRALHAAPMAALRHHSGFDVSPGVLPSDRPPAGRVLRPVGVQVLDLPPDKAKEVADLVSTTDGMIYHFYFDGTLPNGKMSIAQAVGHKPLTPSELKNYEAKK